MYQVTPSLPASPFSSILALDYESYYDSEYTLQKLSTSEYVRDPRFKAHGMAVKTIAGSTSSPTEWVEGRHLVDYLATVDWSSTALLCHNTAFDGLITSHHYGHIPAYYLDTMSMARALHDHSIGAGLDEVSIYYGGKGKKARILDKIKGKQILTPEEEIELAVYAIQDVDEMVHIFLKMIEKMPEDELDLIHITINMFCNPVLEVNHALAREELIQEIIRRETILDEVSSLIVDAGYYDIIQETIFNEKVYKTETGRAKGEALARAKWDAIPRLEKVQSILSSNKLFPLLLQALGESVATKPGKNAAIPAISKNDLEFKRLQASDTPYVAQVCEARLNVKSTIGESRAARLIQHSLPRLPIMLNYCKAHTMRWSGGDKLNPQNFPAARKGNPARLRRAIIAPRGYYIGVGDSSQIEDRLNCWVSGENAILSLYRDKKDVYGHQAEKLYKAPEGSITKYTDPGKRDQGKIARLGLGYGCGADKYRLINQIGMFGPPQPNYSKEEAKNAVDIYRESNPNIVSTWAFLQDKILPLMYRNEEYQWIPDNSDEVLMTFHREGVDMPNGLTLWYPELEGTQDFFTGLYSGFTYKAGKNGGRTKIYGGLFLENLIQCLARIIVGWQMKQIAEFLRVVMMTHDENIFLLPYKGADERMQDALDIMSVSPDWCKSLPLAAEGGYAKEYSK